MNVSAVTKSGSVAVPRLALRLLPRLAFAGQRPLEQHRRHREAEEQVSILRAATSAARSVLPGFNKRPQQGVLLRRLRSAAAAGRPGLALQRRPDAQAAQRRLLRVPDQSNGQNLNSRSAACVIPQGFPDAGDAGAEQQPGARTSRRSAASWPTSTRSRTTTTRTTSYNYVYSQLEPTNRTDFKTRFD